MDDKYWGNGHAVMHTTEEMEAVKTMFGEAGVLFGRLE